MKNIHVLNQQIYITSDEALPYDSSIFDSGAFYHIDPVRDVHIITKHTFKPNPHFCKRIILTTDQDLIKDGVQAIDDEFLEWFVKNPTCESIEVEEVYPLNCCIKKEGKTKMNNGCMERNRCLSYKIIIPQEEPKSHIEYTNTNDFTSMIYNSQKEELKTGYVKSETEFLGVEFTLKDGSKKFIPKQEPLEEAAENYVRNESDATLKLISKYSFKDGAKWQAERSYSYDELRRIAYNAYCFGQLDEPTEGKFNQWIAEFKK